MTNHRHSRFITILSSVALSALMAGSAASADIKLSGVLYGISDPYFVTIQCGAEKEAASLGVTINWKNVTSYEASQAAQAIDAAILTNPAGLITTVEDSLRGPLQAVMDKGILVSGVNWISTPPSYYQTAITASADKVIADVAALIVKDMGGSGTIVVLGGKPGDAGLVARWKPLVSAIAAAAPKIKILDTQFEGFDPNQAATIVQAMITAHPDVKAVYTASGPAGQGAVAGIQQSGMQGQAFVYSYDAVPAVVEGVKSGAVKALIAQPAGLIGRQAVKTAVEWIKAHPNNSDPIKPNETSKVELPPKLLTAENINEDWASDYKYVASCSK